MEFRPTYRGPLKANRGVKDKQEIRRVIHPQLKRLWQQQPLVQFAKYADPSRPLGDGDISLVEPIGTFLFVPLVSSRWYTVADISVLFLRPSEPGQLISHGGDIDNRMKTLLDALRMPKANELPRSAAPEEGETPFFCLFQDDALITALSVTTDRLLDSKSQSEVQFVIHLNVKPTKMVWGNMGI